MTPKLIAPSFEPQACFLVTLLCESYRGSPLTILIEDIKSKSSTPIKLKKQKIECRNDALNVVGVNLSPFQKTYQISIRVIGVHSGLAIFSMVFEDQPCDGTGKCWHSMKVLSHSLFAFSV
jgi:hypothetical protein